MPKRRASYPAPAPLTQAEITRLNTGPPEVQAVIRYLVECQITDEEPRAATVWSIWQYGDRAHPARGTDRTRVRSKIDGRWRVPHADTTRLLRHLADEWAVKYSPGEPGSLRMKVAVRKHYEPEVRRMLVERDGWEDCPAAGCVNVIKPGTIACPKHWQRVPAGLRKVIVAARVADNLQRYEMAAATAADILRTNR